MYQGSIIVKIENNLAKFPNMTDVMDMGYSIKKIIAEMILKGFDLKFTEEINAQYKCGCSRSKMEQTLNLLTKEELEHIYNNEESVEVKCQYCSTSYNFEKQIAKRILDRKS